jgi:hypothetical protein
MRTVRRRTVPSLVFAVLFIGSSAASTLNAPVARVVDGDSLIVLVDREQMRVRLKEIDAPELKQPYGKRSRQSLADLCAVKPARVVWTEKDRNGRLLARVWCSGIDPNAEQVRRGLAWVFVKYGSALRSQGESEAACHRRVNREVQGAAAPDPGRHASGAGLRLRSERMAALPSGPRGCLGGDEFVAIDPTRGSVRFLGRLGE